MVLHQKAYECMIRVEPKSFIEATNLRGKMIKLTVVIIQMGRQRMCSGHKQKPKICWRKVENPICAQMLHLAALKPKNFLCRNIHCDIGCILCDYTWELAEHLFVHCPYSKEIWQLLLGRNNHYPVSCTYNDLTTSILSRVYLHCKGFQTLAKFHILAFVWKSSHEGNLHIFNINTYCMLLFLKSTVY